MKPKKAALVAAAPEMYSVLLGVLETLEDRGYIESGGTTHEWIREALAKVEGVDPDAPCRICGSARYHAPGCLGDPRTP